MQALFQHPHSLRLVKRSAFLSFHSFRRSVENGQNVDSFRRSFWSLGLHNIATASVVAVGRFHSFRRSRENGQNVNSFRRSGMGRCSGNRCRGWKSGECYGVVMPGAMLLRKSGGNMFIGGSEGQNEVSERQLDGLEGFQEEFAKILRGFWEDF